MTDRDLAAALNARRARIGDLGTAGMEPGVALYHRVLRHFYRIHPPPAEWGADNWKDEQWREKIDRIISTYKKKAEKAGLKSKPSVSPKAASKVAATAAAFMTTQELHEPTWEELLCKAYRDQKGVDPKVLYRSRNRHRHESAQVSGEVPTSTAADTSALAPTPAPTTIQEPKAAPIRAPAPSPTAAAVENRAAMSIASEAQAQQPSTEPRAAAQARHDQTNKGAASAMSNEVDGANSDEDATTTSDYSEDECEMPVPMPTILPEWPFGYALFCTPTSSRVDMSHRRRIAQILHPFNQEWWPDEWHAGKDLTLQVMTHRRNGTK